MDRTSADYAPSRTPGGRGGIVSNVEHGSPAQRGGLIPGDVIVSADGVDLLDIIDWQWFADEDIVELGVIDANGDAREVVLERDLAESWGVDFADVLFDEIHVCKNACTFCFMSMLPKHMRSPLYLRDDDYRLSFLQGNFVTLTNLTDEDVDRIIEQHLAPLHVSVHAWDEDVRRSLIGRNAARGREVLVHLLDAGIPIHAQIVLVPGANDGAVLDDTLAHLLAYGEVLSIGIVPLGFTKHQTRYDSSFDTPDSARAVIEQVAPLQEAQRRAHGETRVHLADEFYLAAGMVPPPAEQYDGFPQFEDGIGMIRSFLDDSEEGRAELATLLDALPRTGRPAATFITGTFFAPVLRETLAAAGDDAPIAVVAVENRFFGGNVGVAGLLTGEDVLRVISDEHIEGPAFLPSVMFNADGLTLDGYTLPGLADSAGIDLRVVLCAPDGVAHAVSSVLS